MTRSIVFFGTSEFAVRVLEGLAAADMRPVLVVTTPDAPAGRERALTPPPAKMKAEALGIPVIQPATLKSSEVFYRLREVKPEVGALAAYGKLVPKTVIDVFPKGILNVHPSLLPRWRGATPAQAALLAGDEKTGVTIILLDEEMDHGPILARRELEIGDLKLENYVTLHEKLAKLGADLLIDTLPKWVANELSPAPQDHAKATFCRKFSREDAKIDWSKPAEEIDRMVRALNPEPGTWTQYEDRRIEDRRRDGYSKRKGKKILKILKITPLSFHCISSYRISFASRPGTVFEHGGHLVVSCGNGAVILDVVQPEGKKPMSGEAFLRGHNELIGGTFD